MIGRIYLWLDQLLRDQHDNGIRWHRLILCQAICGFNYGCLMGSFGPWDMDRFYYALYSGIKVPLLIWITLSLCLPVFFVVTTLLGLRDDLQRTLSHLLTASTIFIIVLLALAPLTLVWYASVSDYTTAILFHGCLFAIASITAQGYLRKIHQPLIQKEGKHRILLNLWLGLYLFVAIQFAWVIRPFIGTPDLPAEFFRSSSWGNAYVAIFKMISGWLSL